jgi:hypothetical protein
LNLIADDIRIDQHGFAVADVDPSGTFVEALSRDSVAAIAVTV